MRLLVSVRSAAEVSAAVAGGADIVDAKEPSRGALGPVSPATLRAIAGRLPPGVPLSVALGDPTDAGSVAAAIAAADGLDPRPREAYVKLGLAGVRDRTGAEELVARAVAAAAGTALRPGVIVVAYADHAAAGALARDVVSRLAAVGGAQGVLLDTCVKDGRDLFSHVDRAELREWVLDTKRAGLLVAVAGSLTGDGFSGLAGLPVDVVGVRGAACLGGRAGQVVEAKVRLAKVALERALQVSAAPVQHIV
jgi:(5-formylfuran-3-yl)methyl phosphate synthase